METERSQPAGGDSSRPSEEVERELDDLAHALRSPLTALQGGLDLLNESARGGLADTGRRGLDVALSATRRLTALVDDTLLLARHRAGRLAPALSIVPAREIVDETVRACRTRDPGGQRKYSVECPGAEVVADVDLVAVTACRLIDLLAGPEGEVSIRVTAGGEHAAFAIGASGGRWKAMHSGDEIALAACRAVFEAHGGTLEAGDGSPGAADRRAWMFTLPTPG